ncbi:MAG: signal recognition particle receptor subunit alpha, partial [Actinomyces sp.]
IEDTLLTSDLGIEVTTSLMDDLRTQAKVLGTSDPEAVRTVLRAELLKLVDPSLDRSLNLERPTPADGAQGTPAAAILMVGVNGTGKTTTCGKLARVLLAQDRTVLMGAADTFRAAAADQLTTWGRRVGVEVVRSDKEGADPASVAYDAAQEEPERSERSSTQARVARAAGTRLVTTAPAAKRMTPPARVSWRVKRESSPPVSP